jgi:hypothetical protein
MNDLCEHDNPIETYPVCIDAQHDCTTGDAHRWNFQNVFVNGVNMESHTDSSEAKG